MKRILSVFLTTVITIIGIGIIQTAAVSPNYTVSSSYASSIYYKNLLNVQLTSDPRTNLIRVAESQIGYTEGNNNNELHGENKNGKGNYTEFGRWCGVSNMAWCAAFVSWCANQAGISTSVIPKASYVSAMKKCGTYYTVGTYTPKIGDLVIFNPNTFGDHVEIVVSADSSGVTTIGGNTGGGTSNGGCVVKKKRTYNMILGFTSPSYGNSASSGSATPAATSKGISNPNQVIRYGQSGAAVSELQRSLNQLIGSGLSVDGKFGDKTLAAVKQFQSKYGLAVDGDAGPNTNGKINALLSGSAQGSKPTTAVPSTPAATSKGISNPNQVIRYGQSGAAVSELQRSLNQLIGANLSVDGKFGDKTIAAVKQFQSKYGLAVDGDAGPKTNGKINELIRGSVHTHNYTGSYFEQTHPHRVYQKCSCGDVQYTGTNQKVEGCQECYPPEHVHSYETYYETAHPHEEYRECSCGKREYTGKNRKIADCEECYPPELAELRYNANGGSNKPAAQQAESGDTITLSATIPVRSGYQFMGWSLTKNGTPQWQAGERFRLEQDTVLYAVWEPEKEKFISDTYTSTNNPKRTLKLQIGIPQMFVDGVRQEIDPGRGTVPIIQNDRTLLPIRAVAESFGAYVIWNETEEKVTIYKDDITMEFWIGSRNAAVNQRTYQMDIVPIVINDRTYMPLRFIAENLGLSVGWNEANQTVTIEGEI